MIYLRMDYWIHLESFQRLEGSTMPFSLGMEGTIRPTITVKVSWNPLLKAIVIEVTAIATG
jgi:hypothetical protein